MSTATVVEAFLEWLELNNMVIAGGVYDRLLGTEALRPLADEDKPAVVADFVKEYAKQTQELPL